MPPSPDEIGIGEEEEQEEGEEMEEEDDEEEGRLPREVNS